jgi:hypothetical protein
MFSAIPLPRRIHVQEVDLWVRDPGDSIFIDEARPDGLCQPM